MKESSLVLLFLLVLSSCAPSKINEAVTCRGGHPEGSGFRLKAVIVVGELTRPISHVPLHCPNMLFGFSGKNAGVVNQLVDAAHRSTDGRAMFEIDAEGELGFDQHLQIPLFTATTVHSVRFIY